MRNVRKDKDKKTGAGPSRVLLTKLNFILPLTKWAVKEDLREKHVSESHLQ